MFFILIFRYINFINSSNIRRRNRIIYKKRV